MADFKIVLVVLGFAGVALGVEYDTAVRQNYMDSTHNAVLAMAQKYTNMYHTFVAYEFYLKEADVALTCFSKWAGRLANELWRQRELLIREMKTRGGQMKYNPADIKTACNAVLAEPQAKLNDVSDTTTRMCICERLLQPNAVLNGRTCPSYSPSSPRWQHGRLLVEDALAALKYMKKQANDLANTADNNNDGSIEQLMRHKIVGRLRNMITHTTQHVTRLRRLATSNYFLGEELYDKDVMCDEDLNNDGSGSLIHIRLQQRNGRKTLTYVQGLYPKYDPKNIMKKATRAINGIGTVVVHPEFGEIIQLQGDQRESMRMFLTNYGYATAEQIKVH